MKSLIASVLMAMTMIFTSISVMAAPSQFNWFWSKIVTDKSGYLTLSQEVVKYRVMVDADDFPKELQRLNTIIAVTAMQGQFSNLEQFQDRVNEKLQNDKILSNFIITDVYIDER